MPKEKNQLLSAFQEGQIIAYPTESTWGLGVDASNKKAVHLLHALKKRPETKSFIILIDQISMINDWIEWKKIPKSIDILEKWPGPLTKIIPASADCPSWLVMNEKIAIRISKHPTVNHILKICKKPLISTSANISRSPVLKSIDEIQACFGNHIKHIEKGTIGGQAPTTIIDIVTGRKIR